VKNWGGVKRKGTSIPLQAAVKVIGHRKKRNCTKRKKKPKEGGGVGLVKVLESWLLNGGGPKKGSIEDKGGGALGKVEGNQKSGGP